MITLEHVSKVFNPGRRNEFTALRDVSLTIPDRSVTVLKGPSGSGKTTLLSIIGCMSRPTSGRVYFNGSPNGGTKCASAGEEIASLPERFLAEIRRSAFGFVFQSFHLARGVSVLENVMLPTYPLGRPRRQSRDRAMALLERFGIAEKAQERPELLSGGQQQRVAIARALVNDPAALIADEPTAHLDSELAKSFMGIVASLKAEGKTIIIASHDPLVHESRLADRVVAFRDGRAVRPEAEVRECVTA